MTSELQTGAAGFWYDESRATGVDVLNALRRFRAAETAAQRRAREALGLGENALAALRILVNAQRERRSVNAKELADKLGITAASTSALVDRLVRSGHVERNRDPADRRGVILTATGPAMDRALAVITALDASALTTAESLPDDAAAVIVEFLAEMARSVEVER